MGDPVARIPVKLSPRASRDSIDGVEGGRLVVKVSAPPVDGKANAALCKLVAGALGIAKSKVAIRSGAASRLKQLEVKGLGQAEVDSIFGFDGRPGLF